MLGSAFCGAVCNVYYRPYLRKYPTLSVSTFAMFASVAALMVVAAAEGSLDTIPQNTTPGWAAVLFIGFSSAVGYVLRLFALKTLPPTEVSVFLGLSPLTAALLGAAWLGEPVTAGLLTGVAAVALGLWLAQH